MGYAITQIWDPVAQSYVDWDGHILPGPDGTLGSVVIKKVLEEKVTRAKGLDVNLPGNSDTTVVTHSVPVGKAHKIFGYALSPDSTGVDKFTVKIDGVAESMVYTRTYQGGDVTDYILIDNTGGAAPVVVTLVAHNADLVTVHKASGHVLVEDVTDSMAPA
jgi:hypothetical protein